MLVLFDNRHFSTLQHTKSELFMFKRIYPAIMMFSIWFPRGWVHILADLVLHANIANGDSGVKISQS